MKKKEILLTMISQERNVNGNIITHMNVCCKKEE